MTVTEIWIGVPCTEAAQSAMLDKGYQLQPHTHGAHRQRYVMAHRRKPQVRWTDEEAETLQRWWGVRTAREIGNMLGRSRNSVIGKADRMGLSYDG